MTMPYCYLTTALLLLTCYTTQPTLCQHTFPLKAALASDTRRSARTSTDALRDALGDDALGDAAQ